jgi:tRNA-splicing endonuclease subunit Sen15
MVDRSPYALGATIANSLGTRAEHSPELCELAATVAFNLKHQHDWSFVTIHSRSPKTDLPLPRPLISGLPPKRVYVHPDEQAEILKAEHASGKKITQTPELEWVLPTHLAESWSLAKLARAFDAIPVTPPVSSKEVDTDQDLEPIGRGWRGNNRQKRILLATLHDDSTVVYYNVHDGIVKPRQN